MPRKQRDRQIQAFPDYWGFSPEDAEGADTVVLSLDEYEVIRLLDREGMTQEQCAAKMQIARTTVTAIYESARRKIAEVLVDGKHLRIAGGSYRISSEGADIHREKGEKEMRLAITYDNGEIFQHFGKTEQFKIYDILDGKITGEQVIGTNGSGHGALAGYLKASGVDALICGGIGMGAQNALDEAGIQYFGGVSGPADEAAKAFAEGTLAYDPNASCDHHGHHHGGETCGAEGCGHHGHHHEGGCGAHGCRR